MGEELNIPQHSINPRDTIILKPFSSIAFPLEHLIHPAAAAGEDGDGPSMTVSANNGLWLRQQWASTVVFISNVVALAAVVWERRQCVGLPGQCRRWLVSGHPEGDDAISIPLFDRQEHPLGGGGSGPIGVEHHLTKWDVISPRSASARVWEESGIARYFFDPPYPIVTSPF